MCGRPHILSMLQPPARWLLIGAVGQLRAPGWSPVEKTAQSPFQQFFSDPSTNRQWKDSLINTAQNSDPFPENVWPTNYCGYASANCALLSSSAFLMIANCAIPQ